MHSGMHVKDLPGRRHRKLSQVPARIPFESPGHADDAVSVVALREKPRSNARYAE